jgi:Tol biopolymer transport system component
MALAPGTRLGAYEIVSLLGKGGMGEVYRARDTKLDREVAIKVLPALFVSDPERVARFQREAKTLASLNHPHIGGIYGLEDADGVRALVLELVEGPTLADRIARGPLPLDEALGTAKQIADALEAAHNQAIIHRDLKPANIKVRDDGTVKVLDFGLAKALEPASGFGLQASGRALAESPTITSPALMTGIGVLLGTAAYMSPEQVKGKPADKRSDIWAFGCVLYEMLTSRRAFPGDDLSDTLAAVLRGEPDWNALPSDDVPPAIRTLIRRCLDKDRRERLGDIAGALFVLRDPLLSGATSGAVPTAAPVAASRTRRALAYVGIALLAAAVTSAGWWAFRPSPQPAQVARFLISLPQNESLLPTVTRVVAISPDGTKLAYISSGGLHMRRMSGGESTVVSRPSAGAVGSATFSPDGESLVFWAGRERKLKRIAATGGAAVTLCDAAVPFGITWGVDGIVFGQGSSGIARVSPEGGSPEVLATVEGDEQAAAPQLLSDGDSLLFTIAPSSATQDAWDRARVVIQSLRSHRRTTIIEGGSEARYLPTGHLVYAAGGVLFARPFDLRRLRPLGPPAPIVEGIRRGSGIRTGLLSPGIWSALQFAVSDTGTLVYVAGPGLLSTDVQLTINDRAGTRTRLKLPPGPYQWPRVSPDGNRLAYGTDDGKEANIWIYDLTREAPARRLTFEGHNRFPVWSGDGKWVAFQSDREGDQAIFRQEADAPGAKNAERLTKPEAGASHAPEAWSPDGETLLFNSTKGSEVALQMLSLSSRRTTPWPGVQTTMWPNAVFSPDGHWVGYAARALDGPAVVYVEPFPPTGLKFQVASGDAHFPVWSRDGRELFYNDASRAVNGRVGFVSAAVATRPSFRVVGSPVQTPRFFNTVASGVARARTYDVLPDGRFVGVADESLLVDQPAISEIQVVLNWFEDLKTRVPTK